MVGELVARAIEERKFALEEGREVRMMTPEEDTGNPMLQAFFDSSGRLLSTAERLCAWVDRPSNPMLEVPGWACPRKNT